MFRFAGSSLAYPFSSGAGRRARYCGDLGDWVVLSATVLLIGSVVMAGSPAFGTGGISDRVERAIMQGQLPVPASAARVSDGSLLR